MKKATFALVTLLCLVAATATFATTAKMTTHGQHARGTIEKVDDAAKSFVLREGKTGRTIFWTDATKVTGGTVKANEKAEVRWMARDGKNVATSVKIASK